MNVTTALAPSSRGGSRAGSSILEGHGVRLSSSIRGAAENGCPARPVGLKNRLPSKWSLLGIRMAVSLI